jgi:predicted deacylase
MAKQPAKRGPALKIGKEKILPGERKKFQLEVASLYDYTKLKIPIEVIRGTKAGPTMFVSAAVHGDEINGVEVIKRLLQTPALKRIRGTLIVVPVVNIFGFINKSRYLPDRRDLNRCFPGSSTGSLGSRLANIFMKEIVNRCTHGIDLHTGAIHRANLPQIRACMDDPETNALARHFGVPVILDSKLRDGSLREAAREREIKTLLFEGGEALRFEEAIIRIALKGCLAVMRRIGLLPRLKAQRSKRPVAAFVAQDSYWVRATHSGSFRVLRRLGDKVKKGDVLAVISDPFGSKPYEVRASRGGIVIGLSRIPLVNRGDAMVHIATFRNSRRVKEAIDRID